MIFIVNGIKKNDYGPVALFSKEEDLLDYYNANHTSRSIYILDISVNPELDIADINKNNMVQNDENGKWINGWISYDEWEEDKGDKI